MNPTEKKQRTKEKLEQEQTHEYHEQRKPDALEQILGKLMDEEAEVSAREHGTERMEDGAPTTVETTDDRDGPRETTENNGDQSQQTYRQVVGKNETPKQTGARNHMDTMETENKHKNEQKRQRGEETQSTTASIEGKNPTSQRKGE